MFSHKKHDPHREAELGRLASITKAPKQVTTLNFRNIPMSCTATNNNTVQLYVHGGGYA